MPKIKVKIIDGPEEMDMMYSLFGRGRGFSVTKFTVEIQDKSKRVTTLSIRIKGLSCHSTQKKVSPGMWTLVEGCYEQDSRHFFKSTNYSHISHTGEAEITYPDYKSE